MNHPLEIFCRNKWNNIRTGFTRSLKGKGGTDTNHIGSKRKYYLHNSLEFLLPHVKHRTIRVIETLHPPGTDSILDNISNDKEEFSGFDGFSDVSDEEMIATPAEIKKEKNISNIADTSSCETSACTSAQSSNSLVKPAPDALTQFMNGIMPEIQELSSKSQRKFKFKLVNLLEELFDEEENERMGKDYF